MAHRHLNIGERIAGGSAILLFIFTFFRWYGIGVVERPDLLFDLQIFEDGGNAWQTLQVTPIFLAVVIVVTVGATLRRLIGREWEPRVSPGAVVSLLGAVAACLILIRIVYQPDLGAEYEGFVFESTVETGILLALAAACGIGYGGRRAMQEEGASLADLYPRRRRDQEQLHD